MSYTNVVFKQNIGRSVNRDQVQRQRIDDRIGFQARFQTAGNLIFNPPQNSTLKVSEDQQRFNKNHQVNDRIVRQQQRDRKDHFYEARLLKRLQRDEKRWRNINGLGYNPISHKYQQSQRGKKLQNYDQGKQVNRYVRSKNIIEKTIPNYNIITGEPTTKIKQNVPEKFKQRVQQKYAAKVDRQKVKYEPKRDKYDYLDDQ